MRICLISGEYPPLQGGVGDYTHELGKALAALGVEVAIITSARVASQVAIGPAQGLPPGGAEQDGGPRRNGGLGEPARRACPTDRQDGVEVYPVIPHWGWGSWGSIAALVQQWGADIVHMQYQAAAYSMHPAANLLPWRLRWGKGHPYIVTTFHDLKVPYLFPKAGPLRWWAMLAMMRWSDATILTNEEDYASRFTLHVSRFTFYAPRSTYLIPIGSNIAVAPPLAYDRAAWRARLGVGAEETLLAYFGFLNESKGGETLIQALAELARCGQPVKLLMVGGQVGDSDPTNVDYLARVKNLIASLGLSERVLWTGFSSAAQVSAHLLAADVGVLPYRDGASFRRGSFLALLAHGLPIVSTVPRGSGDARSLDSGLPRLQDGANVRLVPPDDAAALAQAIAELIASPEARQHLATGARTLAAAFAWENIAKQHLAVYNDVVSRFG
ncbi:MAG: glycosyltransferase family 4 protein [Chloroflexi bacterium]|nr:glycosyltransferase family 4 protein [Chloroflexota bacterium]